MQIFEFQRIHSMAEALGDGQRPEINAAVVEQNDPAQAAQNGLAEVARNDPGQLEQNDPDQVAQNHPTQVAQNHPAQVEQRPAAVDLQGRWDALQQLLAISPGHPLDVYDTQLRQVPRTSTKFFGAASSDTSLPTHRIYCSVVTTTASPLPPTLTAPPFPILLLYNTQLTRLIDRWRSWWVCLWRRIPLPSCWT